MIRTHQTEKPKTHHKHTNSQNKDQTPYTYTHIKKFFFENAKELPRKPWKQTHSKRKSNPKNQPNDNTIAKNTNNKQRHVKKHKNLTNHIVEYE